MVPKWKMLQFFTWTESVVWDSLGSEIMHNNVEKWAKTGRMPRKCNECGQSRVPLPLTLFIGTVSPGTINSRHREEWWSGSKAPRFLLQCVYSVKRPTFLLRTQGGGQWINECCGQVDILCNSCTRIRKWSNKVYNNRASTYHPLFCSELSWWNLCSDSYSEGSELNLSLPSVVALGSETNANVIHCKNVETASSNFLPG